MEDPTTIVMNLFSSTPFLALLFLQSFQLLHAVEEGAFVVKEVREKNVELVREKAQKSRAKAMGKAQRAGWKTRLFDKDGQLEAALIDIDTEGNPVYIGPTNENAAISTSADLVRQNAPYFLDGSGILVGVWDSGAVLTTHQEFSGDRITVVDLPETSTDYHATHVAGTIGASGVTERAKGMAPAVEILSYDFFSDESEMASVAAAVSNDPGKVSISNHSYGTITGWRGSTFYGSLADGEDRDFGIYNSTTRLWDSITYAAPYYLPFKSAGNDRNDSAPSSGSTFTYFNSGVATTKAYVPGTDPPGDGQVNGGYDTIPTYGNAKNIITVGATADAVNSSTSTRSLAEATITSFSGWGPADDGRIKPDIVANGSSLYSSSDSSDSSYRTVSGTSMSAPNASGSAALLQQQYAILFAGQWMRAATLKGLILHSADDIGNPGPDYTNGWGLMNTKSAADIIRLQALHSSEDILVEDSLSSSDSLDTYALTSDGAQQIRATICWTDVPGVSRFSLDDRTPSLVNDLDIRISGPDGTELPFILDPEAPSQSATRGDNVVDNVEQILIPSPSAGNYTITVSHKGTLVNSTQNYSLILTGQSGLEVVALPNIRIADTTVEEDVAGGLAVLQLTLDQAATAPVSFQYDTVSGTAFDDVSVPSSLADFSQSSGTVTFQPGELTGSIEIPIIDDALVESQETFLVQLSGVSNNAILLDASATVTIVDNEIGLAPCQIAVFDNPAYIDTSNNSDSEGDNIQAALSTLGHSVTTFTGISAQDWDDAFNNFDLVVLPEIEVSDLFDDLSSAARTTIVNHVNAGEGLIVFSANRSNNNIVSLLDGLFGWSLVKGDDYDGGNESFDLVSPTPGNFVGAPPSLLGYIGTVTFQTSSLPAGSESLYQLASSSSETVAFRKDSVIYLGWSWAAPNQDLNGDWDTVLNLSVQALGCTLSSSSNAPSELFEDVDVIDFDGYSITFTLDGAGDYIYQSNSISSLPFDPTLGSLLAISSSDDATEQVFLPTGKTFPYFSSVETSFYVGTNGVIKFGDDFSDFSESLSEQHLYRQIAALWEDLNPGNSGDIRVLEESDRMVISFDQVTNFSIDNSNTFQVELFFDGRVRLSYLGIDTEECLIGLSPGSLTYNAATFLEEDFVIDDGSFPVNITIGDVTTSEDSVTVSIPVNLDNPANATVTIDYATVDGTATSASDYSARVDTLSIPTGSTTGNILINLIDDSVPEALESFTVTISNPSQGTLLDVTGEVLITDDDSSSGNSCRIAVFDNATYVDTAGAFNSESDNVQFALASLGHVVTTFTGIAASDWNTAFNDSDLVVIPEIEIADLNADLSSAARTAIANQVSAGKGLLVFADNSSNSNIISLLDGVFNWSLVRGDRYNDSTQSFDLVSPVLPDFVGAPISLLGHITSVTFTDSSLPVNTDRLYELPGAGDETLAFKNGNVIYLGWAFAEPDLDTTGDWNALLNLSVRSLGCESVADQIDITIDNGFVGEAAGNASLAVNLSAPSTSILTIDYATSDGSATTPGDYVASSGTLSIPVGSTIGSISIPIVDDSVAESTEEFFLTLSNPSQGTIVDGSAEIVITDTDSSGGGSGGIGPPCHIALFDNPTYVDTAGNFNSESDNLQLALTNLGHTVSTFTGITAADWDAAFLNSDLVVIPELELFSANLSNDLSTAALTTISNHVSGGEGLLVFADNSSNSNIRPLLNSLFGWSLIDAFAFNGVREDSQVDLVTPPSAQFATAPPFLLTHITTVGVLVDQLPANSEVLYQVATPVDRTIAFRNGSVGYLGWTWAEPDRDITGSWSTLLDLMVRNLGCGLGFTPSSTAPTEVFDASNLIDVDGFSLTFIPDGANNYTYQTAPIVTLPVDPTLGTILSSASSNNDSASPVFVPSGKSFPFFGVPETRFDVDSNGYIGFSNSFSDSSQSLASHLDERQISVLWNNLDPSLQGNIRYLEESDRMVISYENIAEAFSSNRNTFQAELFFDGRIRLSYLGLDTTEAIIGLSGSNTAVAAFQPENFVQVLGDLDLCATINADANTVTLQWNSTPGETYRIVSHPTLNITSTPWTPVLSNIPASTTSQTSRTLSRPATSSYFYRVETQP